MTGLLVSVRSRQEAEIALQAGVRLIDLKEPSSGALAATSVETWHEVAELAQGKTTLSLALGELFDRNSTFDALHSVHPRRLTTELAAQADLSRSSPSGAIRDPIIPSAASPEVLTSHPQALIPDAFSYAKVGLSGAAVEPTSWRLTWRAWRERLPTCTQPVLVHYADAKRCHAPSCAETREAILELRPAAVLIDTFHKEGRNVFDEMSANEIGSIFASARAVHATTVLGGSLTMKVIWQAIECQPDWIAVRGAACQTTRRSDIDRDRIDELIKCLERHQ